MSALEALLRLSAIQAELLALADALEPTKRARIVRSSARVLNLLRCDEPVVTSREGRRRPMSVVVARIRLRWLLRPWFSASTSNDVTPTEGGAA